ncbi:MAG: hypothetical protein F6K55_37110 [Moorea sp. SIO4A3]|nr:hypothetical protein [Moorena sp. SIO4A3]
MGNYQFLGSPPSNFSVVLKVVIKAVLIASTMSGKMPLSIILCLVASASPKFLIPSQQRLLLVEAPIGLTLPVLFA